MHTSLTFIHYTVDWQSRTILQLLILKFADCSVIQIVSSFLGQPADFKFLQRESEALLAEAEEPEGHRGGKWLSPPPTHTHTYHTYTHAIKSAPLILLAIIRAQHQRLGLHNGGAYSHMPWLEREVFRPLFLQPPVPLLSIFRSPLFLVPPTLSKSLILLYPCCTLTNTVQLYLHGVCDSRIAGTLCAHSRLVCDLQWFQDNGSIIANKLHALYVCPQCIVH